MTERELRRAVRRYRAALDRAALAERARDDAIRQALAEGWTQPHVARVVELTKQRIHQIANGGSE